MAIKSKKKSKHQSNIKRIMFIVIVVLSLFLIFGSIYYFVRYNTQQYDAKKLLDDLSHIKSKEKTAVKKVIMPKNTHARIVTKTMKQKLPFIERGKEKKVEKKQNIPITTQRKKPKLAIIIDDVHTKKQIATIKKLNLHITPSIFPPYVLSKHSNRLAKLVKHSMIHLPMESGSRQFNKQYKTLMTSFSDEKLADRVMELRRLFPHTTYVNNHTGSVFTSHYKAMKKLYIALKMEGFKFVDSVTDSTSKVDKIAREFGDRYIKRDIFLDNTDTISYIHKQLKKAVKKAKKHGYAIAIGHPHKSTMKALSSAKQILKDVELVYIDEI